MSNKMASSPGLEPRLTEPKSVVLPITLRGKMVRLERLELSWDKTRQILSLQCMPIPPQPHIGAGPGIRTPHPPIMSRLH